MKLFKILIKNIFFKISSILFLFCSTLYAFIVFWGEVIGEKHWYTNELGQKIERYVILPFDVGIYKMTNGNLTIGSTIIEDVAIKKFLSNFFCFEIFLAILLSIWFSFKKKE